MISILIADDHGITRQGLRVLLEKKENFKVVAEAETGRSAVMLAHKHRPDLIVMDINMPELNGIGAARQILGERPETKIIALTMYSDRSYIIEMLKAKVSGYILKSCVFEELHEAIMTVMRNLTYLSPKISDIVRKEFITMLQSSESGVIDLLTDGELEVLQLITEGVKTKVIAQRLHVSVKTIEARRRRIMEKLRIDTIAGLTRFAIREKLISLDL